MDLSLFLMDPYSHKNINLCNMFVTSLVNIGLAIEVAHLFKALHAV